jgi:hypothetical protein
MLQYLSQFHRRSISYVAVCHQCQWQSVDAVHLFISLDRLTRGLEVVGCTAARP